MQNGSFDHLIGQLDRRLERIEITLDRIDAHVRELEDKASQAKGGWTVLTIIGGIAGAVGGFASKWIG